MITKRIMAVALMILLAASLAMAADFPAGTKFTVRVSNELSSGKNNAGDAWEGVLSRDVVVNGKVLARAGAPVRGKVTSAKSSGRLHAPGQLVVRLTSINGKAVSTGSLYRKGKSHTKSNATKIGGGAAAGAVIGALAGGGKGAAAATGKQEAVIPAESTLTFTSR